MHESERERDGDTENECVAQAVGKAIRLARAQRRGGGEEAEQPERSRQSRHANYMESGALTPISVKTRASIVFAAMQSASRASRSSRSSARILHSV